MRRGKLQEPLALAHVLQFFQVLGLMPSFIDNQWPPELKEWFGWASIFNVNTQFLQPECANPIFRSFETIFYVVLLIPVLVCAGLFLQVCVLRFATWCVRHPGRAVWLRLPLGRALSQRLRECVGLQLLKDQAVARAIKETQTNTQFHTTLVLIHDTLLSETYIERMAGSLHMELAEVQSMIATLLLQGEKGLSDLVWVVHNTRKSMLKGFPGLQTEREIQTKKELIAALEEHIISHQANQHKSKHLNRSSIEQGSGQNAIKTLPAASFCTRLKTQLWRLKHPQARLMVLLTVSPTKEEIELHANTMIGVAIKFLSFSYLFLSLRCLNTFDCLAEIDAGTGEVVNFMMDQQV